MIRRIQPVLVAIPLAFALAAVDSTAVAVHIQTRNILIQAGPADFGGGSCHDNGSPCAPGSIDWDFTTDANGVIQVTARLTGRLFADSCFNAYASLLVTFKSAQAGAVPLLGPVAYSVSGGVFTCANNPSNQQPVDVSHTAPTLHSVRLELFDNDPTTPAVTATYVSPDLRSFTSVRIDNTPPVFQAGLVQLRRTNGNMSGKVNGLLFWNGTPGGIARLQVDFLDRNDVLLERSPFVNASVTSPPNSSNVDIFSTQSVVLGRLWKIRVRVGRAGFTLNGQPTILGAMSQTFDFVGNFSTGTFELSPEDADVEVGQRLTSAFSWTVPEPLNWHDLQALRFRILDGTDVVASVYFDEATRTFALIDDQTGKISQAYLAGSNHRLQTPTATLHLRDSGVSASGPTSPTVTLILSLSFKPQVAGRWLAVEVAADDDQGNQGDFEPAGSITVF